MSKSCQQAKTALNSGPLSWNIGAVPLRSVELGELLGSKQQRGDCGYMAAAMLWQHTKSVCTSWVRHFGCGHKCSCTVPLTSRSSAGTQVHHRPDMKLLCAQPAATWSAVGTHTQQACSFLTRRCCCLCCKLRCALSRSLGCSSSLNLASKNMLPRQ